MKYVVFSCGLWRIHYWLKTIISEQSFVKSRSSAEIQSGIPNHIHLFINAENNEKDQFILSTIIENSQGHLPCSREYAVRISVIKIHENVPVTILRICTPSMFLVRFPNILTKLETRIQTYTEKRWYKSTRTSHVEHLKNGIGWSPELNWEHWTWYVWNFTVK